MWCRLYGVTGFGVGRWGFDFDGKITIALAGLWGGRGCLGSRGFRWSPLAIGDRRSAAGDVVGGEGLDADLFDGEGAVGVLFDVGHAFAGVEVVVGFFDLGSEGFDGVVGVVEGLA